MTTKRLFIPITKVDATKGIVYGVAASATPDRAGEVLDYAGSKPYFEKWSEGISKATAGKSLGNLRAMHGAVAAGKLEQLSFNDEDEQVEVAAKVVDVNELQKVLEGVYTGFSIGGKYISREKDGDTTKYIADPYEISLVDLPCIPDATFEVIKATGTELRKFHIESTEPAPKAPTSSDVAKKAEELAKAAGQPDDWADFIAQARAELMKSAPTAEAKVDLEPKHVLKFAVTAVDDAPAADDLGATQAWTHAELPGETFAKKSDLRAALDAKRASAVADRLATPVTAALKSLTEAIDERDPLRKNSSDNPDFAGKDEKDPKAGKDAKDKKAPPKPQGRDEKTKAKDEADKSKPMKSAVDVIARANALLDQKVPSFVEKRAIVAAAHEFGALTVLPEGFIESPSVEPLAKVAKPELAKAATLYSVSQLISILGSMDSLEASISGEKPSYSYYGGGDTVVTASPEVVSAIKAAMKTFGECAAKLLDEVLAGMHQDDAEKAVGRGTVLADLRKVGARNSTKDKARLKSAHDLLAEIEPEMCGHNTEKLAGGGDVAKMLQAQETAFSKKMDDLTVVIADVAKRVKAIAEQPVNGRPSHVTIVEKFAGDGVNISTDPNAREQNRSAFLDIESERTRLAMPKR